ncbi:hypothetical protein Tco_0309873 [Tanacetum coccineum]
MLCKPKSFYDEKNKVAIGYKNPLCLTRAKQAQSALYNGHVLVTTNHTPTVIHDSEDTREIAEITRKRMLNLTPEQIFWSIDDNDRKKAETSVPKPISALTVYPPNTPVKLVPRILPTKSQVKINLYVLTQLFTEFDKTCKKRITPTGVTEGERGFEQTKRCYLTEVIPFFKTLKEHFVGVQTALFKEVKVMEEIFDQMNNEVDKNTVDKQCAEIVKKNLLIENENLIANCLSTQLLYDVEKSRCLDLEADMSKVHNESKHISKLEREYLNLQLKYQHLQESFDNKKSHTVQEAPDFNSFFKIKNLEHQIQEKDNVIRDLKVLVANVNDRSCEPYNAKDVTALIEQNDCVIVEQKRIGRKEIGTLPKKFNKEIQGTLPTPVLGKTILPFSDNPELHLQHTETRSHQNVQQLYPCDSFSRENASTKQADQSLEQYKEKRILPAKKRIKKKVESVHLRQITNATPTVKRVLNKGKQIWKPKGKLSDNRLNKTKQVWKAKGKLFADIGYQWKPTGKKFTLGKLDCGYQWRPTGKKFALGEMCPLTKLSVKCSTLSANQQDPNKNWGTEIPNSPNSTVFKCRSYSLFNLEKQEVLPTNQNLKKQIWKLLSYPHKDLCGPMEFQILKEDIQLSHRGKTIQIHRDMLIKAKDDRGPSDPDYKEYKISENDFKNLHPNDFEDLNIVIRKRMEDLQLGIKSYQMKLNLEQPNWDAFDFLFKEDYTIVYKPRAIIYKDRNDQKKMMKENEGHKAWRIANGLKTIKEGVKTLSSYERCHKGVKASANSDIVYFFTSAQDGDILQDDERLYLADDLQKAQDHNQRQANDESKDYYPNVQDIK